MLVLAAENAFRKPPNKIKKSVLRGPIRRKNNKKVRDVNKTKIWFDMSTTAQLSQYNQLLK